MANKPGPREIFRSIVTFKNEERPFHFEAMGFWKETIDRWHKEGLPQDKMPWEYFDIYPIMDNSHESIRNLAETVTFPAYYPYFEKEIIEEKEDYIVCMEEDGIIKKTKKDGVSMPQFLQFPVQTREDWEKIKFRLNPDIEERYEKFKENVNEIKDHKYILRFGLCGCYGFLRNLFGEENLAYAYYDEPEFLHRIMEQWVYLYKGIADRICPLAEFDYVFIWEDMAFKTAPLISPKIFKEFMSPYYREFISHMKRSHGLNLFMVDSDGNNFDILSLFVEAGVNIFIPCEIAARMEPQIVRGKYPGLALLGGIDKRALISGKPSIREEIMRKVPALIKQGGYIPSVDHHVPSDVSFENFSYYIEFLRKTMK